MLIYNAARLDQTGNDDGVSFQAEARRLLTLLQKDNSLDSVAPFQYEPTRSNPTAPAPVGIACVVKKGTDSPSQHKRRRNGSCRLTKKQKQRKQRLSYGSSWLIHH